MAYRESIARVGTAFGVMALQATSAGCPPTSRASTPQAFVGATLGPSSAPSAVGACRALSATPVLALGADPGQGTPETVTDGEIIGGVTARVACSVKPAGMTAFAISLSASTSGATTGSVTIQSGQDAPVTPPSGASNVSVALDASSVGYGSFRSQECILDLSTSRLASHVAIAGGRVWGHVSCPMVSEANGAMTVLADGGAVAEICALDVSFLFEGCDE
jgi:hypothetical protein